MRCNDGCAVLGFVGFALVHPVAGLVAQPFLAIKALVHAIYLNYHWRHTVNEKGVHMNEESISSYMSKETKFTAVDLTRLEHEAKRIEQRDQLFETLRWMRGLAKCMIPILGLIWAGGTELGRGGSMNLTCEGCMSHDRHWKDSEAVAFHLSRLRAPIPAHPIETDSLRLASSKI